MAWIQILGYSVIPTVYTNSIPNNGPLCDTFGPGLAVSVRFRRAILQLQQPVQREIPLLLP